VQHLDPVVDDRTHIKAPTLVFGGAEDSLPGSAALFRERMTSSPIDDHAIAAVVQTVGNLSMMFALIRAAIVVLGQVAFFAADVQRLTRRRTTRLYEPDRAPW